MHPILAHFGDNFFIGTYGLMIAIGMIAALSVVSWLGKRKRIDPDVFVNLTILAVVSGFIGARILFIIVGFDDFIDDPMAMIFSRTGFVFLGGFIAAVSSLSWYVLSRKLDYWLLADIAAPGVALAHGFGRIGCHLAGCCFGGVCESHLGTTFPKVTLPDGEYWQINPWFDHYYKGLIPEESVHSLPVWPVQLMESGALFLLTGVLVALLMYRQRKGMVFGVYLASYAVIRFSLEFLRGDADRGLWFDGLMSTSQIISIGMLAAGIAIIATSKKRAFVEPVIEAAKSEDVSQDSESGTAEISSKIARRRKRRAKR